MTWDCCGSDQVHAQATVKPALQRVIFGFYVLWVLEAKKIGFREYFW
jgi:hypothetical protein